ncbi:Hsp70 family protein [Micromonosporaceae bacterium Da 78-11]
MHPSGPCLGIDYGSAYTKAVLVLPSGQWTLLTFDGGLALSNAVHVGSGEDLVGAAAWQYADTAPAGFMRSPLQAGDRLVRLNDAEVDPADLVAATLRRVAGQAAELAGEPVVDVRMVVPAGWGPRRRTWWRRAASKAGLGRVQLVEAPVAVTTRLAQGDTTAAAVWLVVDVGSGCEVSVVRRAYGGGLDVLSTMADAAAGGDSIDTAMAEAILGVSLDDVVAVQRWPLLAGIRAAKHALAEQPAVTMPLPDKPPVVITTAMVRQAVLPVFERAGTLAAEALANADVTLTELDAVYAVGASMGLPGAADMIGGKLGITPHVPEQPGFVAVLGIAETPPTPAAGAAHQPALAGGLPPLRSLVRLGLPGALSLLLYAHFVFSAEFNNGTPAAPRPYYYVLASWGELTVAATLALLTCLQAAALIDAVLHGSPTSAGPVDQAQGATMSSGIGLAAAGGMTVASLYAVTAAVYFAQPVSVLLRWSVAPLVPAVMCAAALAVIAWRRRPAVGSWDAFLAFPLSSSVAAAAGTFAVSGWWQGHMPAWLNGWQSLLGYAGGLLIGVALACAVARHLVMRVVLALLLGFLCMIISRSGPGILAVIYALSIAGWCGYRAWTLFRVAPVGPAR